jgi:hypothetical protein
MFYIRLGLLAGGKVFQLGYGRTGFGGVGGGDEE